MKTDKSARVESDNHKAGEALRDLVSSPGVARADGPPAAELAEGDPDMSLIAREGRLVVIAPRGLWVENAKVFQHAILARITDSIRAVDLNLSAIARFDTWALCTLLSLRRYFSARLIRFRLIEPSSRVEMILEMTKTRSLFEVAGAGGASAAPGAGAVAQVEGGG